MVNGETTDLLKWVINLGAFGLVSWLVRHTFTHFHLEIHPSVLHINNSAECVMDGSGRVWYNTANPDRLGLAAPVARLIEEFSQIAIGEDE